MLAARIATAVVLLALVGAGLFFLSNAWWSAALLCVLARAGFEWAVLGGYSAVGRWAYTVLVVAIAAGLLHQVDGTLEIVVYWAAAAFWLLAVPLWLIRKWESNSPLALGAAGCLVLIPTGLALARLQATPHDLIAVLAIVWIADTAAYLVGRRYGRHHLASRISPGKTWEGLAGASVAVAVYYSVLWLILGGGRSLADAASLLLLLAAVTAMSVQGDLLESWMKRQAGVKDSGALLPGHGGVLDRIDGLTAGVPLAALWLHYFNHPGLL
jgi:phosphatidate cytidylyltransferase